MQTIIGMIESENWMFATGNDDDYVSHTSRNGPPRSTGGLKSLTHLWAGANYYERHGLDLEEVLKLERESLLESA